MSRKISRLNRRPKIIGVRYGSNFPLIDIGDSHLVKGIKKGIVNGKANKVFFITMLVGKFLFFIPIIFILWIIFNV